ncbi:MAG: hypothetical protein KIT58_21120 [Planctomycetota bacterium]|nr:hypothetical protein [Planctomycetota bacterium]
MTEQAEVLRKALREGRSPSLARRRGVAALSALAMIDAGLVALQQMGAVRLPDPPGPFDTDAVVGSREAYVFGAPDARRSGRRPTPWRSCSPARAATGASGVTRPGRWRWPASWAARAS